jgi:RimJ/RimL family protein N-acetyltransferase
MRYWGGSAMNTPNQARKFLGEVLHDLRGHLCLHWGIARRDSDEIIGTLALFHLDMLAGKAEIGFALARACWGMGYMNEALRVALEYSFREWGLRRVEADVDPRNLSSIRLLEGLGFQKEGYLRERWPAAGEVQDSLFYGLLRREWNSAGAVYRVSGRARSSSCALRAWVAHSRLRRWAAMIMAVLSQ